MLLYDYHMHSNYSPDSNMSLNDLVKTAISKGLREICITDHVDNLNMKNYSLPNYTKFLEELELTKSKYPEIIIKFGAEIGLTPVLRENAKEVYQKYDYDFVIGSSHECNKNHLYVSSPFFENLSKKESFTLYFEEVLDNVKNLTCYDVYGHLDYIYRYSNYENNSLDYFDYKDIIDEILKTIIYNGKGIEINTSGFRYGLNNIHPSLDILKSYKSLGGEIITVGSDSHIISHIYDGFDFAYNALKEANFDYITTFDKQKPSFVKI